MRGEVRTARFVEAAAAVLVFASTAVLLVATARHVDYVADDIWSFYLARTTPLPEFVRTPIDVHYVPLHRAVSYALAWLFPMRFGAGLTLLAACYAAALHATWRVLKRLVPARWALPFLALFAANGCMHSLFFWFSAGLHRLPFLAATAYAVDRYLAYRDEPRLSRALAVAGLQIVALGFFSKALFLPLYLAGLELVLPVQHSPRRKGWTLIGCLTALSACVALLQAVFRREALGAPNLDVAFQLEFLRVSLLMTAGSLLGFLYTEKPAQIVAIAVLLLGAVVPVVLRDRKSAVAWGVLALLVVVNVLAVSGLGSRTSLFGIFMAWGSYRYYVDIAWLVTVFVAAAWGPLLAERAPAGASRRPVAGAVTLGLVAVHAVALWQTEAVRLGVYGDTERARIWLGHLRGSAARQHPARAEPLELVDGDAPMYVLSWVGRRWPVSPVLVAMGFEVHTGPPRRGAWAADDEGNLVPAEPPRRRHR
jgi:hypothetical protein